VSLSGFSGTVWPFGSVAVAGTPLAPSGPDLTAPTASASLGRSAGGALATEP
jgi:hypothetical protein